GGMGGGWGGGGEEGGWGRAGGGGLGRGEQAAIEAADHEGEQQQRRPDVTQPFEALLPGAARSRWQEGGPRHADDRDGDHVHGDRERARQNSGDKQLADVLLRDQA